jgi:multidrug resistance protein MdtO
MTIAATLVMIIVVTFRIPNAALAGLFSILLARENLAATWRGGQFIVLGFVLASLYTLLGMMLFRGYPITHFFWVIGSLYLIFFVIRTTTNYAAALAFVLPIGVALPVWDRSVPSQVQVEGTLWPIVIIAVGTGATVLTEALYRIFDRSDPLITFVDDLLLAVQQVVESLAAHRVLPEPVLARVLQYQMIGTGRLRMTLQRQGVDPTRRAQRAALISLAGRLIGLAANFERTLSARRRRCDPPTRTLCEARSNPNGASRVWGYFRISSSARGAAVLWLPHASRDGTNRRPHPRSLSTR